MPQTLPDVFTASIHLKNIGNTFATHDCMNESLYQGMDN